MILALSLLITTVHAHADCSAFRPIEEALACTPTATSKTAEWSEFLQYRYEAARRSSDEIYRTYRAGQWNPDNFSSCALQQQDLDNLKIAIPVRFFELSLAELSRSRDPSIQAFVKEVTVRSTGNNILPFRLVGHIRQDDSAQGLAGFHRGHQSIFMNFDQIPARDWLIIYTHELFHALDSKLIEGMQAYGDPQVNEKIHDLIASGKALKELSPDERGVVKNWLIGGLNRGYLAEARAWSLTLQFYTTLKKEKLQVVIPWLEDILKERRAGESDFMLMLRYLDKRFIDPTENIFAKPLIQESLAKVRERIRDGGIQVDLGSLRAYAVERQEPLRATLKNLPKR